MLDEKELRAVYTAGMIELAKTDEDICLLEADLAACVGTTKFRDAYPDRFFNVGIAEANMVGVAAGLATCGKKPYCHSFTAFMTRRAIDQIAISVCYSKLNVKMVGSDPGIMATNNGGTHMSMEDVGLMRSIPNMTIVEPVDSAMLKSLLPQIVANENPMYIRLFRKKTEKVFEDGTQFDLYKATEIKGGKDCVIICAGIMTHRAIKASELLAEEGLDVGVLCVHTLKPIDEEAIIRVAKQSGKVVVAENHNYMNGLGSAVCEVLSENYPVKVKRVGVKDCFGEVGSEAYLEKLMGLDVESIIDAVKSTLK